MTTGRGAAVTEPPENPSQAGPGGAGPGGAGPCGPGPGGAASAAFERRIGPGSELADRAEQITKTAHAMAVRFHRGGKLVVFGTGGASTDAQHVAVEFVHPVIVGKRALPAISLTTDVATVTAIAERDGVPAIFSYQIRLHRDPPAIALGSSADGDSSGVVAGLEAARV